MTMLSARLAQTLARGRAQPAPPASRPRLLELLLRKRIRWALPVDRGE